MKRKLKDIDFKKIWEEHKFKFAYITSALLVVSLVIIMMLGANKGDDDNKIANNNKPGITNNMKPGKEDKKDDSIVVVDETKKDESDDLEKDNTKENDDFEKQEIEEKENIKEEKKSNSIFDIFKKDDKKNNSSSNKKPTTNSTNKPSTNNNSNVSNSKPSNKPSKPAEKPTTKPNKPAEKPAEKPANKPSKPIEKPSKPTEKPSKPVEKPADKPSKPVEKPSKPAEPKVEWKVTTEDHDIPADLEIREDNSIFWFDNGHGDTIQKSEMGIKRITKKQKYVNGKPEGDVQVSEEIIKQPKNEIIVVGTKSGHYDDKGLQQEALNLINNHRANHGLPAVKLGGSLFSEAQTRSQEISVLFEHHRPNGAPLKYGENIAMSRGDSYLSPASVVNGWINSPGHNAALLYDNNGKDITANLSWYLDKGSVYVVYIYQTY